jgi:predicted ATP-grasp superfamily ATP-dependent carboligase
VASIEYETRPSLTDPALICAFRGWNDGGEAATTAATYLRDRWEAERFAHIDPEEFFDFQVTRPRVKLEDGMTREIEWPATDLFHASQGGRDVVLLIGIEPNMRWRTFIQTVLGAASDLGVKTLITLGAFLADLPHTLPTPITGSASDEKEAAEIGLTPSRYEGPTGVVGVLHDTARRGGMHSVSLWAAVPHYLPTGPNPKAALALVEKAAGLAGVEVETETLSRAAATWERQISDAIGQNEELKAYVQQLEETAEERETLGPIPSGDEIAEEVQRFLREQRGER